LNSVSFLLKRKPARTPPHHSKIKIPRKQNQNGKCGAGEGGYDGAGTQPRRIRSGWSGRSGVTEFSSPRHLPRNFWAEHQKEKCPFHFKRKSPPRKYKEARDIFSFWCCRVKRGGGGAIRGAYAAVQS
jgi:hypothetical protein